MNTFLVFLPLALLAAFFVLRIPVGLGMIASCVVYFFVTGKDIGLVSDTIMSQLYASSVMIAIPLFIFTANIMSSGKVTDYMFTFIKALIGKRRGALAYLNILISLVFSGMTGSAAADAAGLGVIEISEMKKDGYDLPFSAAITAATSIVGPIFPPSIPMVIYAMLAQVSVGKLFMGGMVPAVLICLGLGAYVWHISAKRNYPEGVSFSRREFWRYTWKALPALFTPVILLGGIYTGFVTPTEAGALAATYTILVAILAYRVLTFRAFLNVVRDTVAQSGYIFAIVAGAYVLSYVVTSSGMGKVVADAVLGITRNKYAFLFVINVVFLVLGMFFDTNVLEFVFLPLVIPVAVALGIDMVHLGVVIVVNLMIGAVTPPFGMMCFIATSISKSRLQDTFREVLPMLAIMLAILALITYVPSVVMFLPNALL